MVKNDNIYVKLQIEKNNHSGGLTLGIYFDKNAPNFSIEKSGMNWTPTLEELEFIFETFDLVSSKKDKALSNNPKIKHHAHNSNPINSSNELPETEIETNPEEIQPITSSPMKQPEQNFLNNENCEEERIFVQADDKLIDEALKRKQAEQAEQFSTESSDKNKIDKVLRDRIKKKI
jgi:hypothetical protein